MSGFVKINTEAAREDAARIEDIVRNIEEDMKKLDVKINQNIPDRVDTHWSRNLVDCWREYSNGDIPRALEGMKASASNLILSVEEFESYSRGE